ncbi:MAG TPA: hypothetical protein VNA20_15430 [Frankiaceae bacterium]|nr:hypothetical protein [Frankiaceae bacterium]
MTPAKRGAANAVPAPTEPVAAPARRAPAKASQAARAAKATRARPATSASAAEAAAKPATPRPVAAPAAKPTAKAAVRPVVKAVATPVTPAVKGGTPPARVTPMAKVTPKPGPAAKPAKAAKAAASSKAAGPAYRPRREVAPPAPVTRLRGPAAPDVEAPSPAVPEVVAPEPVPEPAGSPYDRNAVPTDTPPRASGGWTGRRTAGRGGDVIGDADERDPDEPVVALDPVAPGIFDELFEPDRHTGRWPLVVRVARGDWRASLFAALPALLVTLVVAAVGVFGLLQAEVPGRDQRFFGTPTAGRFLRYVFAAVGATFGGPVSFATEADMGEGTEQFGSYAVRAVPLTATLVALVAVWLFARRAQERNVVPDRVADAVRIAAVFAAGVGALSLLGRWTRDTPTTNEFAAEFAFRTTGEVAVWRPMFWAFCGVFLTAWLATGRFSPGERLRTWLVAARGALVGLAAGAAASLLLLVLLGYGYVDRAGGEASHVTRGVPLAIGYGVNFGVSVFGVLCGGRLEVPFGSERPEWSLWSPWVPNSFALLLVVPALAVTAAAYYVVRRGGLDADGTLRACDRMAGPAAGAWLLLAIAGRLHYGLDAEQARRVGGDLSAGPVLWAALLVALWFGAGGWVAGRVLTRRAARAAAPGADALEPAPEAAPAP